MPKYTLDTLKYIVSFLDWTCDFETLACVSILLKLKHGEEQQILAYWKSKTKFRTFVCSGFTITLVNGKFHKRDGPAIYTDYLKLWFVNGVRHRIDGPAVEWKNVKKEYWLNGVKISRFTFWFRKITCRI